MAVSRARPHMLTLYHRGRGHEPVTVAGSIRSFVAVRAISVSFPPNDAPEHRDSRQPSIASGSWPGSVRCQLPRGKHRFGLGLARGASRVLPADRIVLKDLARFKQPVVTRPNAPPLDRV
jgi:hypothetical protein